MANKYIKWHNTFQLPLRAMKIDSSFVCWRPPKPINPNTHQIATTNCCLFCGLLCQKLPKLEQQQYYHYLNSAIFITWILHDIANNHSIGAYDHTVWITNRFF